MTKSRPCQALRDLIDSNRIDLRVTGWVERNQQEVIPAEKGNTVNSTKKIKSSQCVTPPNSNQTPTQNSDPKLRTPNQTATPTGPRTDRTALYESPRPIGTLPAGPIVTTTGAADRAGQLGGMTKQGVTEGVPKLCTEA